MKREIRKLFEKVTRANHLNARGRRAYKRQFAREYQETVAKVQQTIAPFTGLPYNDETRDAMVDSLMDAFPAPMPERIVETAYVGADGVMNITLTQEASQLLRAVTPAQAALQ